MSVVTAEDLKVLYEADLREEVGNLLVSKDTDENYLAVCQARETGENGLRLDAVGNLISSTVLSGCPPRVAVQPPPRSGGEDLLTLRRLCRRGGQK